MPVSAYFAEGLPLRAFPSRVVNLALTANHVASSTMRHSGISTTIWRLLPTMFRNWQRWLISAGSALSAAVMLKRREQRELFLVRGMPAELDRSIDLRGSNMGAEIVEAFDCLFAGGGRTLRIIAATHHPRGREGFRTPLVPRRHAHRLYLEPH